MQTQQLLLVNLSNSPIVDFFYLFAKKVLVLVKFKMKLEDAKQTKFRALGSQKVSNEGKKKILFLEKKKLFL